MDTNTAKICYEKYRQRCKITINLLNPYIKYAWKICAITLFIFHWFVVTRMIDVPSSKWTMPLKSNIFIHKLRCFYTISFQLPITLNL